MTSRNHALVVGGSGVIGSAVVLALAARGVSVVFTYHRGEERARALAERSGSTALSLDLRPRGSAEDLFARLDARGVVCDVLVHCAAARAMAPLDALGEDAIDDAFQISGRSAILLTRAFAARLARAEAKREGHVVLVGALDRTQSLPLPPAFAAAQGSLAPIAMSLAKSLGKDGVRVNLVAGGPVGAGTSTDLDPPSIEAYRRLSALRRLGSPEELAAPVVWLALDNTYMTGKVLSANGGI